MKVSAVSGWCHDPLVVTGSPKVNERTKRLHVVEKGRYGFD